ncbi:hypothetical protein [uncultured Polaribacter sp.]|uniref:hypothetical protein n=1 Tax=uncultured Polaribacter sp. TaxID=174711 RepID=UPI0026048567|nr:hypothetical protein [uncultured Polaribacter sp.]
MNILQLKKRLAFVVMFGFLLTFTINAKANVVSSVDCFENSIIPAELNDTETIYYPIEYYDFKNGKWKRFWRDVLEGILTEILTPIAPPNDNDNDFSREDLKAIQSFAKEKIGSKEEALELYYKMEMLILSENQYIKENELLEVFKKDNSMRDLLNKIFNKKNKTTSSNKVNFKNRNLKTTTKADTKLSEKAIKFKGNRGDIIIDKNQPKNIGRLIGRIIGKIIKHFI